MLSLPREPWVEEAVCVQVDPEVFYPDQGNTGNARVARQVCNGGPRSEPCPVRTECLNYALEHGERYGIWGGLSEQERRRFKRRAA